MIQTFSPIYHVDECLSQIRECLEKGWTGQGFKTLEFEKKWKEYTGLPNAYFLCNATAGLNLTLRILKEDLGWGNDGEVISSPITFVATNNSILYNGMQPVMADIDDTLCLDPLDVERKITNKTKAVIFVGLGGNVGNYEKIVHLCKKYGLRLILDAAHLSGARYKGKTPGSEADAVVYSYHVTKNLTTADSGM
ncbi:MAG: DegT/DnrJ/EryC1/StrS aminotransferase family protein, partial [Selenomonadaceae bacterium]|nr:DegT/DnrJ/EryC1/StrS aminotransferase family protein [Selenomonadaceae bacterium]